jgi:hypothetical protein
MSRAGTSDSARIFSTCCKQRLGRHPGALCASRSTRIDLPETLDPETTDRVSSTSAMRNPGSFKLIGRHNRRSETRSSEMDPVSLSFDRETRIVESLRSQILAGGEDQQFRIRQVFEGPRAIYRIEIEVPEMSYQRTTLLDGDALEELLAHEDVRQIVDARLV